MPEWPGGNDGARNRRPEKAVYNIKATMFSRFLTVFAGLTHRVGTNSGRGLSRYYPALAIAFCMNALLIWLDAIDNVYAFTQTYETWQLDSVLTTLIVGGMAALYISVRQMREIKLEAERRATAEGLLADAVNTMHQGIAMYDEDERLVICNGRYADIYRLPPELVRPGTELKAVIDWYKDASAPGEPSNETYRAEMRANLREGGVHKAVREFKDGRAVFIIYQPRQAGGWVSTHEDITERRRLEQRLNYLAHHDALTGLANRVLLRERLDAALGQVKPQDSLAVFCLDLDQFKTINDTLGHPVGDLLLKSVAEALRSCAGETDLVARMGGDEFAILQSGAAQPEGATRLATRIIEALGKPHHIGGQRVASGASIGISIAPADGNEPDQLLKQADLALYRAKQDGRGIYRFFEAEMDRRIHERRQLELDLREALNNGQFELHYQPILDLSSNEVCGLEALIRWNHPTQGRISPARFVPIAEETGLIVPIGEWVLREACAQSARWPDHIDIAVNVSPLQIRSAGLVQTVFSALSVAGVQARRLELEITETILLQDSEATLATLHQLRALGVRIAMDDFGTGYSSLSYFRSFPFDKIKIDRSFVQGLNEGRSSLAILRAIASLAGSLGMTTTAEGVETEEQLEKIRREGITQAQGFLISPPRPAAELDALIRAPVAGRMAV
jgi:diguanylate cyclase (GGDEF)-like protein